MPLPVEREIPPGTPEWTDEMRRLLLTWSRWINTDPEIAARQEEYLLRRRLEAPEAFQLAVNDVAGELTTPEANGQQTTDQMLQDFLNAFGSGTGGAFSQNLSTTRNISENRTTYVDVPTPEEFLDNFKTAFLGYAQGMRQVGGISQKELTWAMENWDVIAAEYTGALAQMALAGQPVFEVVGAAGIPELIGARPGEQYTQVGTEATTGTQSVGGGPAEPQNMTQETKTTFNQNEVLMKRPNLALVNTLSPTEWLQKNFPVEKLQLLFAKEVPTAGRYTGGLAAYGQPRRING